jgi:hypothetical protein
VVRLASSSNRNAASPRLSSNALYAFKRAHTTARQRETRCGTRVAETLVGEECDYLVLVDLMNDLLYIDAKLLVLCKHLRRSLERRGVPLASAHGANEE